MVFSRNKGDETMGAKFKNAPQEIHISEMRLADVGLVVSSRDDDGPKKGEIVVPIPSYDPMRFRSIGTPWEYLPPFTADCKVSVMREGDLIAIT